jgi:hypothetical protein
VGGVSVSCDVVLLKVELKLGGGVEPKTRRGTLRNVVVAGV